MFLSFHLQYLVLTPSHMPPAVHQPSLEELLEGLLHHMEEQEAAHMEEASLNHILPCKNPSGAALMPNASNIDPKTEFTVQPFTYKFSISHNGSE